MIKFLDLQKINAQYAGELKQAASDVIDSGWFLHGEKVKRFEEILADFIGVKHAIGVANGLDALRLIFKAYIDLGVLKVGDEIIAPANTFIASILAITDNQLVPVLVEPDIKSYNLDDSNLEKYISNKTKAILVVHLYGRVCWSEKLEKLSKKHNLKIIEDNAQAIGAIYQRGISYPYIRTGALGHASGFSFYPGKNLGALGDAGAVLTDDNLLAQTVRALGNYGSKTKYICESQGLNSRINELQAAFLTVKLNFLEVENRKRKEIAKYYLENIRHPEIILPFLDTQDHVWHLFVIRCQRRDILKTYLEKNGIQTQIHYPVPPHKQKAYKTLNSLNLPITETIHEQVLSLPLNPVLTEAEVMYIVEVINNFK